jgi:DNA-binding NarL/FixJ family response regulator
MKILLVYDQIMVREGVHPLLSGMQGASIFGAATGQEEVPSFARRSPSWCCSI